MGATTNIAWCDATFNPWRGCTKIAPGCTNCYADTMSKRNPGTLGVWGPNGSRVRASDAMWREPLKWNREAGENYAAYQSEVPLHDAGDLAPYVRPRVFCASLADVFEDWTGAVQDHKGELIEQGTGFATLDDLRRDLFALIDATPNLDWLLLTKRPENIQRMWGVNPDPYAVPTERRNVWLGTSISDQATADKNLPELLKCRDLAPVLFASYEPALGPVDFTRLYLPDRSGFWNGLDGRLHAKATFDNGQEGMVATVDPISGALDWIIFGGESGSNSRPCDVSWARSTIEQCRAAGVPCFHKQVGSHVIERSPIDRCSWPGLTQFLWDRVMLKDKKGGDISEWPEELRVRQFPRKESHACG